MFAVAGWRRATAWLGVATAAASSLAAGTCSPGSGAGAACVAGGLLRADALTALMLHRHRRGRAAGDCWASPGLPGRRPRRPRRPGSAGTASSLQLFVAAMAAAVLAGNLGVLWVAIEATTIVTAFLVGHHRTRTALEAAWKYVVICSVGIAIAFLGTVLLYYAARHAGLTGAGALDWTASPPTPPASTPASPASRSACWCSGSAPRPGSPRCTPGCPTPTARPRPRSPR